MPQNAAARAGFAFINLSDPSQQSKTPGVRRLIRSHVSVVQHRVRRGNVDKLSARYLAKTTRNVNAWASQTDACPDFASANRCRREHSEEHVEGNTAAEPDSGIHGRHDERRVVAEPSGETSPSSMGIQHAGIRKISKQARILAPSARHLNDLQLQSVILNTDLGDPDAVHGLCQALGLLKLSLRDCLDFQASWLSGVLGDIETKVAVPSGSGIAFIESQLRCSTAYFAVYIMIGVANIKRKSGLPRDDAAFLGLRGFVLACVQRTIEDRGTYLSDGAIMGVASLSFYEALYGSRRQALVHMRGLSSMVRLRRLEDESLLGTLVLYLNIITDTTLGD